jgi:hypothetical protein
MNETALFATIGYKIYNSPPGVNFDDVPYGEIGVASQKLNSEMTVGGMLDAAKSPDPAGAGRRELSVYVERKIVPGTKITVSALKGFSNGSPDFGAGIFVSHIF